MIPRFLTPVLLLAAVAPVSLLERDQIEKMAVISSGQGIQADWSYQESGCPVVSPDALNLVRSAQDISLENPIIDSFAREGLSYLVWKGEIDPSFRQEGQSLEGISLKKKGLDRARWFPSSDYGVYRGRRWYASLRMQSSRTSGPDGVLTILPGSLPDDEHHRPGTTAGDGPYGRNRSPRVHGFVYGDMMCAGMELKNIELSANKSYFFFRDAIVCLGTGISPRIDSAAVVTTVEDCPLKGRVKSDSLSVRHNGRKYISLDSKPFELSREGGRLSLSRKGDSYAYAVIPRSLFGLRRLRCRVVNNDIASQAVCCRGYLLAVFHIPGKCRLGTENFDIEVPSIVVFKGNEIVARSPIPQF